MADVDVQKLSRKELLQLCSDHDIRTAGVKHDDLIQLLQKKLNPPASNPPRGTPKARSQIITSDSPLCSPNAKGKAPERASLPTPASISQGRGLRPLVLVEPRLRNDSAPELPSPRTPRKDVPSPGAPLPRKPITTTTTTKSNIATTPTAQRSDLLRKKASNALIAIGKLQAQERARSGVTSSSARGRNSTIAAGKLIQAQDPGRLHSQSVDRGPSVRSSSRSGAAIGAQKKSGRSSSTPAKRPGDQRRNELATSRKGQISAKISPGATSSEAGPSSSRASEGTQEGQISDLGSHSFGSVSEAATDAPGHRDALWEDSDADDARSVSSEPISRLASERVYSPRISTGSKLGLVAYPESWEESSGAPGDHSSVESTTGPAPLGIKDSNLSTENLISLEVDAAFDLVGDAHEVEINSFFDTHSPVPDSSEKDETAPSSAMQNLDKSTDDSANPNESKQEDNSTATPSGTGSEEEIDMIPIASSRNDDDLPVHQDTDGAHPRASLRQNSTSRLVSELSASSYSPPPPPPPPHHQESSGLQLTGSGKDYTTTSTSSPELVARVHFNLDGAPLPHPNMDRSLMSSVNDRPVALLTPVDDNTADDDSLNHLCVGGKPSSPCDDDNDLEEGLDIKLRGAPKQHHDYNKDKSKKSLQSDGSEKVPLLQDGHENGSNTALIRRSFPFSILLWCSQLFSAIFGTRSQR